MDLHIDGCQCAVSDGAADSARKCETGVKLNAAQRLLFLVCGNGSHCDQVLREFKPF